MRLMVNLLLMIGTSELLLIAALVLLLFGGKKLPEMMKGLGQGVRSFKDGMKEISDPDSDEPHSRQQMHSTEQTSTSKVDKTDKQTEENGK